MKYNEEEILKEIIEYIESTYNQHYSTDGKGLQAMDIFRNMDTDKDFCQSNAIKYLIRYGKKQGRNEKDLIKAIHYIVLLISSEREKQPIDSTNPINIHGEEIKDWKTTIGQTYHPDHDKHKEQQQLLQKERHWVL
jgi:hypothetical protein|tara:strand:+ start:1094 stop:1501 length:408 start_codon:yes stop_codon:yes gene_type:complete